MNTADRDRLVDYIYGQHETMVGMLQSLTLAESPSGNAAAQQRVKRILVNLLEGLGFSVRLLSGRELGGCVFARPMQRTRGAGLQLLLGHFDTVWPVGTLEHMPFEVEGNVVRGPGVFDMKGGIAQTIVALKALGELDLRPPLTPIIFLNSDEEIGSHESRRHIERLARIAERTYVLEPALGIEGAIKTARKGVGRFVVRVKGKAAHAGLDPHSGASAILELSHVIQQLFELNDPDKGISVNVGTVDGGIRPNVIAPEGKAMVDVRVATREDGSAIEAAIFAMKPQLPGVQLEIDGGIGRPPLDPTPANERLWLFASKTARDLGFELKRGLAGGGSDGSTTSQYTATLDGMGAVGDGAHAPHEHLLMYETLQRTILLAMMLMAPSMKE